MSYRPLNNELRDSLYNNEPYIVAHLIKFEKPSISTNYTGISAETVLDYSYLTDAAVDISFDDGTFSRREQYQQDAYALDSSLSAPLANGEQIYHANKVLKVGTINEGIEAKASTLSLKLDATSLGTTISASCTFNADQNTIVTDIDLSEQGFVEGDKLLFGGGGTNTGLSVIVNRFTSGGTTLKATTAGGTWNTQNTSSLYTISQISEELNTLILGNGNVSYTNYINREVTIYRVHMDPNTNAIIGGRPGFTGPGSTYTSGGAMLLFKGIISNAALTEDPKKGTVMTWSLSSHWGDFVRVQNRITQDAEHRALDVTGRPDKNMLLRQEYAGDMGFAHSELALNLIATYNKKETRTRLRYKKKNLGMSKKAIQEEYEVDVPTDVDLKLNLKAQALPVVYGVQKIDSIPFFFDNLKNNNTRVYAGYALCEGSIGGVLDIIIEDKSTICVDEKDSAARSSQSEEENIEVVCKGRQDAGNTLVGTPASQGVGIYTHTTFTNRPSLSGRYGRMFQDKLANAGAQDEPIYGSHYYTQETRTMDAGGVGFKGIQHEEAYRFTTPIDCTLVFHKGTSSQRANHMLVEKADGGLFKIQNDYFEGNPSSYWTPNHRVLDTAYCVGEYQIEAGEVEIPSLDFVVRGRDVDCHNYDGSYSHRAAFSSENPANFNAGDTVYLTGAGFSEITTTIIDKWSFIDGDGETQHRFRWATSPTPTGYKLRMSTQSGEGGTEWHMHVGSAIVKTGSITSKLSADLAATQAAGKFVVDSNVSSAFELAVNAPDTYELSPGVNDPTPKRRAMFSLTRSNDVNRRGTLQDSSFGFGAYDSSSNQLSDVVNLPSDVTPDISEIDVDEILLRNAIQFPSGGTPNLASTPSNSLEYVGATVTLYRFDSTTNIPYVQEREIISWLVSSNDVVAFVGEAWDPGYEPKASDLYSITTKKDARVSINPAMQLLDYMQSKRYGKGLKDSDIDLTTFKAAAQQCDTRSDVIVVIDTSAVPAIGDVYRRNFGGNLHFQGTVKSVSAPFNIEGKTADYREVTFTDVIGKIAQKWDSYNYYAEGQAVWKIDSSGVTRLRRKSGTGGTLTDFVGGTSNDITGLQLNRVSGSGATAIQVDGDPDITAGDGNPLVKSRDGGGSLTASGYTLYDSDNVKYWKYLGWDSRAQRNVTRHQLNQTIQTTNTVFENINGMLRQFNGILRYSNGSYQLSIKSKSPSLSAYEKVKEEDIVGQIKLTDKGSKKTYNSVSASIVDPQNGFETRSVSFFNSTYLREDNGVPKKGSFATPSISNYFNARFNIKQFLDESRNGLEIQFNTRPSGLLLLAGEIIALTYERFGWDDKLWRITNLNFLDNGQVAVTAEEHSDGAYIVNATKDSDGVSNKQSGPGTVVLDQMQPPNSLTATTGSQAGIGGIKLLWRHGAGYNPATHDVQVFSSTKNKRTVDVVANGAGTESTSLTVDNASDVAVGTTLANGTSIKTITNGDSYPIAVYEISVVGDTNWAALDAGSETNFGVGDLVVPSSTGTFSGTGQMREINQTIEVTAVNGNVITLSSPFTWTNDQTITFRATLLAGRLDTSTFTDPVTEVSQSNTTRYYWIRYAVDAPVQNIAGAVSRRQFSVFEPATVEGIEGTNLAANVLRGVDLRVEPGTSFTYETDGTGIDSNYNATATITAQGINGLGTAAYKFEQVTGVGSTTLLQDFSTDADLVFTPPNAFTATPGTVRVTFRDTYLGSEYFATAEVTFTGNRITSDGNQGIAGNTFTVTATNMGQKLRALSTGAVPAAERFASVVKIVKNGSNMAYDGGNSPASGTWHWGTVTEITGGSRFAVQLGSASLTLTGTFYNANTDQNTIEFDVAIEDDQNVTIGAVRYSIEKIPGLRDIGNLTLSITGTPTETTSGGDTFTEYQHSTITTGGASLTFGRTRDWCGGGVNVHIGHTEMANSTSTSAIKIASTLVTPDADGVKRLRNGDRFRIEVVEDATAAVAMGDTYLAGERIYIGPNITEAEAAALGATARSHNYWSTLVAEKVYGSMIVDGTLSANAVNANDVRTKTLLVESSMVLGTSGTTQSSSNKGKIYSAGKSTFTSGTNGFFLGWEDNTAKAKFALGDNNDFIKFDGTNISIKNHGDFTLKSTSSTNTSRLEIVNDVIEIYSGTESTPRVKIGNLSQRGSQK